MQAGESFAKTWRMRNTGTTRWGPGYTLAFLKDEQMTELNSVALPVAEPGEEVDVTVRLAAPLQSGAWRSTWRPRNPDGEFFGHRFYALITVPPPIPPVQQDRAQFIEHGNLPPGSTLTAGQTFTKVWRVRNVGTTTWGSGYTLAFIAGEQMGGPTSSSIPAAGPNATVRMRIRLRAPDTPGRYRGDWRLRGPQGDFFGPRFVLSIKVK